MNELEYFNQDDLAASTWRSKYADDGEKNPDDMHMRMAVEFARVDNVYNESNNKRPYKEHLSPYGKERKQLTTESIYELFKDFKYIIPAGSVMAGLGTKRLVSLSNCMVIAGPEDSYSSIMETRNNQVQLMKRRCGVGYDLSGVRPRGAKVNNAAKYATGAASLMDVSSDVTNEVAQDGRRKMFFN